jgi:hypothetical protein
MAVFFIIAAPQNKIKPILAQAKAQDDRRGFELKAAKETKGGS